MYFLQQPVKTSPPTKSSRLLALSSIAAPHFHQQTRRIIPDLIQLQNTPRGHYVSIPFMLCSGSWRLDYYPHGIDPGRYDAVYCGPARNVCIRLRLISRCKDLDGHTASIVIALSNDITLRGEMMIDANAVGHVWSTSNSLASLSDCWMSNIVDVTISVAMEETLSSCSRLHI